jgi:hypothetical protein
MTIYLLACLQCGILACVLCSRLLIKGRLTMLPVSILSFNYNQ